MTTTNPAANPLLTVKLPGIPSKAETPGKSPSPDSAISLLTRQMAAGDEEAFRQFHQLYFDRLYQFLLTVARGQEQEARDALQETLIRVARSSRGFESEEIFWCWLKAVAHNAARDGGRQTAHRVSWLCKKFAQQSPAQSADCDIGATLDECLDELDPEDRILIEAKVPARRNCPGNIQAGRMDGKGSRIASSARAAAASGAGWCKNFKREL